MDHTIDSNKDFMHVSQFCFFFFNFPIALKKSPDIKDFLGKIASDYFIKLFLYVYYPFKNFFI